MIDLDTQLGILATSLINSSYFSRVKRGFGESNPFSNDEMKFIYELAKYYHENSGSLPDGTLIVNEARANFDDDEVPIRIAAMSVDVFNKRKEIMEFSNGTAYVNKASELGFEQAVKKYSKDLATLIRANDFEGAEKLISTSQPRLASARASYDIIDWHSSFEDRFTTEKKLSQAGHSLISCGFRVIDKDIGGGIRPSLGEIVSIQGATGFGKTACLTAMSRNLLTDQVGGIFINGESHASHVAMRHDVNFTGIDSARFRKFDFTPREERILLDFYQQKREDLDRYLFIASPPRVADLNGPMSRGIPLQMIFDIVENESHKIKNFKYIVIDSGSHLDDTDKQFKNQKERMKHCMWTIDYYLESIGKCGLISFQSNRSGAKETSNESIGDAIDISQCSDFMIGIERPKEDDFATDKDMIPDEEEYTGGVEYISREGMAKERRYNLKLTKSRAGDIDIKYPLDAILSRMMYFAEGERNGSLIDILGNQYA